MILPNPKETDVKYRTSQTSLLRLLENVRCITCLFARWQARKHLIFILNALLFLYVFVAVRWHGANDWGAVDFFPCADTYTHTQKKHITKTQNGDVYLQKQLMSVICFIPKCVLFIWWGLLNRFAVLFQVWEPLSHFDGQLRTEPPHKDAAEHTFNIVIWYVKYEVKNGFWETWFQNAYLSPDTDIRCLQSLVNFIPVTISKRGQQTQCLDLISVLKRICIFKDLTWVAKHGGHTFSSVEVKDADVFVWAACGHIETRGIRLNLINTFRWINNCMTESKSIIWTNIKPNLLTQGLPTLIRVPSSPWDPL